MFRKFFNNFGELKMKKKLKKNEKKKLKILKAIDKFKNKITSSAHPGAQ